MKSVDAEQLKRRFSLHGDAPSRLLEWGVQHCPPPLEPILLAFWSTVIWILAGKQRNAVAANLHALFPGEPAWRAQLRVWRVFWSFANTEVEAVHCLRLGAKFDWEVEGREHFDQLAAAEGGAMILTAHMSNYDVAAYLFAGRLRKPLHTVRAPEATPELQALKEAEREHHFQGRLRIHYNTQAEDALGLELLRALQAGEVVAIQGDRLVGSAAMENASFGGIPCRLPVGPFALASAARGCQVFPLFIVRMGRRRYRIICKPPLDVVRNRTPGEGRHGFQDSMDAWGGILAEVARKYWFQWYVFEPLFAPGAAWPGPDRKPPKIRESGALIDVAPSRCRTAFCRVFGLLALSLAKLIRQPVTGRPESGIEHYFSASRDQSEFETGLYAVAIAAHFSILSLSAFDTSPPLVWWAALLTMPLWVPVLLHLVLLAILILATPVRRGLRLSAGSGQSLHWALFQAALLAMALGAVALYLHRWGSLNTVLFGELPKYFLDVPEGFREPSKLYMISALTVILWQLINLPLFCLLPLLRGPIRRLEAGLPLNQLPEQFGDIVRREAPAAPQGA